MNIGRATSAVARLFLYPKNEMCAKRRIGEEYFGEIADNFQGKGKPFAYMGDKNYNVYVQLDVKLSEKLHKILEEES